MVELMSQWLTALATTDQSVHWRRGKMLLESVLLLAYLKK